MKSRNGAHSLRMTSWRETLMGGRPGRSSGVGNQFHSGLGRGSPALFGGCTGDSCIPHFPRLRSPLENVGSHGQG